MGFWRPHNHPPRHCSKWDFEFFFCHHFLLCRIRINCGFFHSIILLFRLSVTFTYLSFIHKLGSYDLTSAHKITWSRNKCPLNDHKVNPWTPQRFEHPLLWKQCLAPTCTFYIEKRPIRSEHSKVWTLFACPKVFTSLRLTVCRYHLRFQPLYYYHYLVHRFIFQIYFKEMWR